MVPYISYFISCLVGTYIVFVFMNNMFTFSFRHKNPFSLWAIKLIFFGIWYSVNLLEIPILNITYFTCSCFILGAFLFDVKQIKEIVQLLVFIISYAGCDSIISALFSVITENSIPFYNQNSYLFLLNVISVEATMLFITKLLVIYLNHRKFNSLHIKQLLFLLIFPLLDLLVFYILSITANSKWDKTTIHSVIVLMIIISTFLNLAVIYFFEYVSKSVQLESDLTLMKQQMDMQYDYYSSLETEYENSQRIMHDIKNHLEVIDKLYQDKQEKGEKYTKKIYDIIEDAKVSFRCNNRILNIIVNKIIKECKNDNIYFEFSVENLDLSFIDDIDITTIFANLLDNAIEACNRITYGNKLIELRIYKYNKMLIINVINTIAEIPLSDDNGNMLSSKDGHKAIGLSNVKYIVEKYSGDININIDQNRFSVNIFFPE